MTTRAKAATTCAFGLLSEPARALSVAVRGVPGTAGAAKYRGIVRRKQLRLRVRCASRAVPRSARFRTGVFRGPRSARAGAAPNPRRYVLDGQYAWPRGAEAVAGLRPGTLRTRTASAASATARRGRRTDLMT